MVVAGCGRYSYSSYSEAGQSRSDRNEGKREIYLGDRAKFADVIGRSVVNAVRYVS